MNVSTTTLSGGVSSESALEATFATRSVSTFDTSVGAEYFLTRGLSLLGGATTNFSTLAALSPTTSVGNLVQSRTNHVAASFGIGSYGAAADFLLGVQLDYGWGQALVVNPYVSPNDFAVVGTQVYTATVVLAGSTNLRAIGRAFEKVKNLTTPAPAGHP